MKLDSIFICSFPSNPTVGKVKDFAKLPAGWHFTEGRAPDEDNIKIALRLLDEMILRGFYVTDAFPGVWGEVRVTGYAGKLPKGYKNYIEFTVESDRTITAVREQNRQQIDDKDNLTLEEALTLLRGWANEIIGISELFPNAFGIGTTKDSKPRSFNPQPMGLEFPFFNLIVQSKLPVVPAPTLEISTHFKMNVCILGNPSKNFT